jgi:hypothetical protein
VNGRTVERASERVNESAAAPGRESTDVRDGADDA